MEHSSIPQGYAPLLSIYETQKAIGLLKRLFEDRLSGALRLHRVSRPSVCGRLFRPQRRPQRRGASCLLRYPGRG